MSDFLKGAILPSGNSTSKRASPANNNDIASLMMEMGLGDSIAKSSAYDGVTTDLGIGYTGTGGVDGFIGDPNTQNAFGGEEDTMSSYERRMLDKEKQDEKVDIPSESISGDSFDDVFSKYLPKKKVTTEEETDIVKEIIEKKEGDDMKNGNDIMDFTQDEVDDEYDEVGGIPQDEDVDIEDYSEYMVDSTEDVLIEESSDESSPDLEDQPETEDEVIETTEEVDLSEKIISDEVIVENSIVEVELPSNTTIVDDNEMETEAIDDDEMETEAIDDDESSENFVEIEEGIKENTKESVSDETEDFDEDAEVDFDVDDDEFDDTEVDEDDSEEETENVLNDIYEDESLDDEYDIDEDDTDDSEINWGIGNSSLSSGSRYNELYEDVSLDDETEEESVDTQDEFVKAFWSNVESIEEMYPGDTIAKYLDENAENINKEILSELYTNELFKYQGHMDTDLDIVQEKLWVIATGKYINSRSYKSTEYHDDDNGKTSKNNSSSNVEVKQEHIKCDGETKDTPEFEQYLKDVKKSNYKYNKTNIDRALIEIKEEESDDNNIFYDTKSIHREFFDSPFYKILTEVMTSDRLVNMDKIKMKIIINKSTAYLPFIDFDSGVRIICIDTNDASQYRISPYILNTNVPFSFKNCRNIKLRMLYSDNIIKRPMATIFALKKIIAFPKYINPKHLVELRQNYVMGYTTERDQILNFENGDIDIKGSYENTTYNISKPCNKNIGFIILVKKSGADKQAVRRTQFNNQQNNPDFLRRTFEDHEFHFVLSAEYICDTSKLNNPILEENEKYVQYIITQYNESNSVVLMDGLQTVCSGIVKEHEKQFGKNTRYSIELEFDRSNLVSPGVTHIIDNGGTPDGFVLERSYTNVVNVRDTQLSYILPPSRLKSEGVLDVEKGRNDRRHMNKATIIDRYLRHDPGLISRYNLDTEDGKAEFIRSRGFEPFVEPKSVVYDVLPNSLSMIETSRSHFKMREVNVKSLMDRNSTDIEQMLNEQMIMEYERGYGDDEFTGFGRTLFNIFDAMIELGSKNK